MMGLDYQATLILIHPKSLGLQIVKTLATNELGGQIEVRRIDSGGTTIHVEIYC